MSPVSRLFLSLFSGSLSCVSVSCLPSHVSRLCSLSPVICILFHMMCPLSPILLSQSPLPRGCTTWTGYFKRREVKTGFYRNRSMQTGSSGTLIGWKSGQTTFVLLWDRMEGAWLRTLTPIYWPIISFSVAVFCSSFSRPTSLFLLISCTLSLIFHTCDLREGVFFLARYHTNAAYAYTL